ncbi:PREDICTED: putative ATP-dependent RNA helicase TDRD9 [Nanorana parkeri]|uniref:putative ATP-dependent RNA helicase TDRD9 n=1 Tax=Nanorana parkeri TaxID=125878 RepID=UPI0008545C80|nr:PREDICTED: putative ATP-dependent RNA helicase TDRD9 [Nanorana parkeri]
MLKKLTVEQIADWFTIGKEVSGVKLLGTCEEPKRAPEPGEDEEQDSCQRAMGPRYECAYVDKFRQLESQELQMYRSTEANLAHYRHKATEVKNMPMLEHDLTYPVLPILNSREKLITLIECNSVVIIQGATGSGKSTQLPQYILDHHMQHSAYCNIVVTQPRKIAACSIATWISKERKWLLSGLIGYQVGLEKKASSDTRLSYVTTGVLLQKIVGAKSLAEFTHIVIDEVHERTEEMDFLLMIVRKLLRTNSRMVKVILMSATINCREFADYFAVPVLNCLVPASIFNVEGKPYDVEVFYLDDLKHIPRHKLEAAAQTFDEPVISKEMFDIATTLIQLFDDMEKERQKTNTSRLSTEPNSVLVFLPGIFEINYMHELFSNMVHKRLHVYPLHSSITLDEQNMVFMAPVIGYRKIILSTNIAESSITVPDVKYVIDFCLTKTLVCDEETNYQSLRLSWASKTNCDQRKGRAGRVSKGYCYRLVWKDFWNNAIPENVVPEMLRSPLGSTVLKVKLLDMGEPRALLATALSPPNVSDIERTILLLKEVGALAVSGKQEENPYDGELTFLGRVLAQLPVDLQLGKLVVLGHVFGCLDECLIIASALSLRNFFAMPFRQHLDGYRSKLSYAGNSRSDCIALVNAFRFWQDCKERGDLRQPKDEMEWGKSNYLQIKRIREVAALYDELKKRVARFNMHVGERTSGDPNYKHKQRFILQVVMAGSFYPNYFAFGSSDQESAIREVGGKDPKTTVVLKHVPPYGFLYHKQIQSLFRQCGQVKSILFDGQRAFVEFSRNPTERFKTLSAVHLAVKMAQMKVPLTLNVHSVGAIEETSKDITDLKLTRVVVDFHKETVEPLHVSQTSKEPSGIIDGPILSINVTEVVEVGHFWGYRIDDRNSNVLGRLAVDINQRELMPLSMHSHPDRICLAPFKNYDISKYYRAQILYISGKDAVVFFVDYGNQSKVELSSLREVPSHFLDIPFQALEFKICKMRPSAKSIICGEQWTREASMKFNSLVSGAALVVKVFSIVHNILHVEVYRYLENLEEVSIRDLLIADGYAEPAEESVESKQSNILLKEVFAASSSVGIKHTCGFEKKKEKERIDSLLESYQNKQFGHPNNKAILYGPFHPYEILFHSMIKGSKFRSVWIEKESINSVLVNDTPEESHQRMFVAASLSVNSTGSLLMLRETSLLPSIPGLPALITMLFAPVIELRVDDMRREYTGALCGLGWQYRNVAVWPEHDIELDFDVRTNTEDLLKINMIREAMNKVVCYSHQGSISSECTVQLQENVREQLLSLFQKEKPREVIPVKCNGKPYQWNQVDTRYLIGLSGRAEEEEENHSCIYQLHKFVLLNP